MKHNLINKSTHILLILTLISHLSFFHNLLDNYVICSGSDGHIAIENVNDCDECSNIQFNGYTKTVEFSSQDCEDTALDQNCFEDDEFIPKDRIVITANIVKLAAIFENTNYEKEFNNSYFNHNLENSILESYTTISLLI
ncbi:MAG: hypothetical protein COW71_10560 [Ignavibacteriales bacterium CG18_big_fil_WC_8_21_14_2_50_31_20]|nr:MAG: hypothetical protein COW71_10560 [Ignavibacteriales bacterium CG18_big_fil_WC_8_21_14_2_50_31_20]